jgi:hypothetical protein
MSRSYTSCLAIAFMACSGTALASFSFYLFKRIPVLHLETGHCRFLSSPYLPIINGGLTSYDAKITSGAERLRMNQQNV